MELGYYCNHGEYMNKPVLFVSLLFLITTAFAVPPSIMPDGMENIHLGMPITELIAIRKNIKSGTTFDSCTSEGPIYCKWYRDPNDPKHLTPYRSRYQLKENYDYLFFDTAGFSFSTQNLIYVAVGGGINTKEKRKGYAKNRDEFILYAVRKWGNPDLISISDDNFTMKGKHDYYVITMYWTRGVHIIRARFPLAVEEYFNSLTLSERFLNTLGEIIGINNYPSVRVDITWNTAFDTSRFIHAGQILTEKEAERMPQSYMPLGVINKKEAEKLLKSIGFEELVMRAMAK